MWAKWFLVLLYYTLNLPGVKSVDGRDMEYGQNGYVKSGSVNIMNNINDKL